MDDVSTRKAAEMPSMGPSVSLTEVGDHSFVIEVGGQAFGATSNADAVGCIAWAYGVEHVFGVNYPDGDTWRWLAWHWCALLSYKKAGLAPAEPEDDLFFEGTLAAAYELAPSVDVANEMSRRYRERVAAIEEQRAQGRYAAQEFVLPNGAF